VPVDCVVLIQNGCPAAFIVKKYVWPLTNVKALLFVPSTEYPLEPLFVTWKFCTILTPVGPVGPPEGPVAPVGPVGPCKPDPVAPVAPVGPAGPVAPAGPVGP